jgi:hypothetical protein
VTKTAGGRRIQRRTGVDDVQGRVPFPNYGKATPSHGGGAREPRRRRACRGCAVTHRRRGELRWQPPSSIRAGDGRWRRRISRGEAGSPATAPGCAARGESPSGGGRRLELRGAVGAGGGDGWLGRLRCGAEGGGALYGGRGGLLGQAEPTAGQLGQTAAAMACWAGRLRYRPNLAEHLRRRTRRKGRLGRTVEHGRDGREACDGPVSIFLNFPSSFNL